MDFIEKLCAYYDLTFAQFQDLTKEITINDLLDYTHFQDIDSVVKRINDAIANNEKIFIYGDYDADGVMATSILVKTFEMLNYQVGYYLPSRYIDGYGLSIEKVKLAYEKGYKLIITVDNGVTQYESIDLARKLGIDVIVTDHHNLPLELPNANYILHPIYSKYGETVCCGAYVAFILSWAMLKKVDEYLLSLASIATISDLMELKSYNRNIVKLGLMAMNTNKYPSIRRLVGYEDKIDEMTIALKIAPKINAIGRILEGIEINRLVKYFTTSSQNDIEKIGDFIEETNNLRKELTSSSTEGYIIDDSEAGIVVFSEEKEGIIGLIANRLLQNYNKPVVVFAKSVEEGIYKGSARSKPGFSIVKAFDELKDLFVVYGGHSQAGGCSIKAENFDEFKIRFNVIAKLHPLIEEQDTTIELNIEEINLHNYQILENLGPFGMGFKAPKFSLPKMKVATLEYSRDYKHIMTPLSMKSKLVGFHISKDDLTSSTWIKIEGKMSKNYFKGNETLQFVIEKYYLD